MPSQGLLLQLLEAAKDANTGVAVALVSIECGQGRRIGACEDVRGAEAGGAAAGATATAAGAGAGAAAAGAAAAAADGAVVVWRALARAALTSAVRNVRAGTGGGGTRLGGAGASGSAWGSAAGGGVSSVRSTSPDRNAAVKSLRPLLRRACRLGLSGLSWTLTDRSDVRRPSSIGSVL